MHYPHCKSDAPERLRLLCPFDVFLLFMLMVAVDWCLIQILASCLFWFCSGASVLLFNAIVFGIPLVLDVFVGILYFPRWRVWKRLQQGQCLHCGYDVRASTERCPECGISIVSPPTPADLPH